VRRCGCRATHCRPCKTPGAANSRWRQNARIRLGNSSDTADRHTASRRPWSVLRRLSHVSFVPLGAPCLSLEFFPSAPPYITTYLQLGMTTPSGARATPHACFTMWSPWPVHIKAPTADEDGRDAPGESEARCRPMRQAAVKRFDGGESACAAPLSSGTGPQPSPLS